MPHFSFTMLTALLLSVVLALLGPRTVYERLCVAAHTFFWCVIATVAGSWTMYLIHG